MFRVLYGVRDQEVTKANNSSTMFSNPTTTRNNNEITHEPSKNNASTVRNGDTHKKASAMLRFPGFSTHEKLEKQFKHADNVWISLNVGGSVYTTTTSTLQKVIRKHVLFVCIVDFRNEGQFYCHDLERISRVPNFYIL